MPDIALTVYAGAFSPTPVARDTLTWDALCDEIAALCREESPATDKRALVALGPYRLRDGANRSIANVESMSAIAALDLDGVDLAPLEARIKELGVAAIIHGSPSDNSESETRKARAYIQLDKEHSPSEAGRVRASVASLLGVTHDAHCSNADRILFCGRLAGTPERYYARFNGSPLKLEELPPPPPTPTPTSTLATAITRSDTSAYEAASCAVLGAIGEASRWDGHKHALCGAIGGMLRKTPGWSREQCEDLVRAWLSPLANRGDVNIKEGVRWACAAWDRIPEDVSGSAALNAIVGERAGAIIREALLLPLRARQVATTSTPAPAPGNDYATLSEIDLTLAPPPLRYVVPALELAAGKVSAIQGYAYTSKTPFALLLATCVAAGVDFLGCPTNQCPVAYIDHEASLLTQERAIRLRAGLALQSVPPLHYFQAEPFSEAMLDEIANLISRHNIGMVVHDTYSSAVPPDFGSFNESSFRTWADSLGRLSQRTGTLFVVLLHDAKLGEGLRGISGHGSLAGALQASIKLSRPDEDDATLVRVSCTRATRKGFEAFDIRWNDVPCENAPEGQAIVAARVGGATSPRTREKNAAASARAAVDTITAGIAIMRDSPVAMTKRQELVALSGGNERAAKRALELLVRRGLLLYAAGSYCRTDLGRAADETAVATALGRVGEFDR